MIDLPPYFEKVLRENLWDLYVEGDAMTQVKRYLIGHPLAQTSLMVHDSDYLALEQERDQLKTRLTDLTTQRQQDALDGQAALDLLGAKLAAMTQGRDNAQAAYEEQRKIVERLTSRIATLLDGREDNVN